MEMVCNDTWIKVFKSSTCARRDIYLFFLSSVLCSIFNWHMLFSVQLGDIVEFVLCHSVHSERIHIWFDRMCANDGVCVCVWVENEHCRLKQIGWNGWKTLSHNTYACILTQTTEFTIQRIQTQMHQNNDTIASYICVYWRNQTLISMAPCIRSKATICRFKAPTPTQTDIIY